MITDKSTGFPLLKFENLSEFNDIKHFITTRSGGFSSFPFNWLNLGYKCGDETLTVSQNRKALSRAIKIRPKKMMIPIQTHSCNIRVIREDIIMHSYTDNKIYFEDTDALVTNVPGLCIMVLLADCVPLIMYDPISKVSAVVHSGWRGTIKKIAVETIKKMTQEFGCDPANIIVGIGPSISKENFEVGPEVVEQFEMVFTVNSSTIIEKIDNGKARIDLWEANKQLLVGAGIKNTHIEISGLCTFNEKDTFYSWRESGGRTGRFAAGIILG